LVLLGFPGDLTGGFVVVLVCIVVAALAAAGPVSTFVGV
jgi:hypothetical protein